MSDRFDPRRFTAEAATALRGAMQAGRYSKSCALPVPHHSIKPSSKSLLVNASLEILILLRFLARQTNSFNDSAVAELYRTLTKWSAGSPAIILHDLFWLRRAVPQQAIPPLFNTTALRTLEHSSLLAQSNGTVTAAAHCFPLSDLYFLSDTDRTEKDFVYFGTDSIWLAEIVQKVCSERRFNRSLDLCTGSGIQGLFISSQSRETLCVDVNERAVEFVRANARLNGVTNVQAIQSNMFAKIEGRFDCIIANTPYVPMPPDPHASDLPLRGGDLGIEFMLAILDELPDRLTDDGVAFIYTVDPISKTHRHLLDQVRQRLQKTPMQVSQFLLSRTYPTSIKLRHHFASVGITAFEDCVLVLQRSKKFHFARRSWQPYYYWGTRLKTCLARKFS